MVEYKVGDIVECILKGCNCGKNRFYKVTGVTIKNLYAENLKTKNTEKFFIEEVRLISNKELVGILYG